MRCCCPMSPRSRLVRAMPAMKICPSCHRSWQRNCLTSDRGSWCRRGVAALGRQQPSLQKMPQLQLEQPKVARMSPAPRLRRPSPTALLLPRLLPRPAPPRPQSLLLQRAPRQRPLLPSRLRLLFRSPQASKRQRKVRMPGNSRRRRVQKRRHWRNRRRMPAQSQATVTRMRRARTLRRLRAKPRSQTTTRTMQIHRVSCSFTASQRRNLMKTRRCRRKVCPGYIAYNRTAQPCWSCSCAKISNWTNYVGGCRGIKRRSWSGFTSSSRKSSRC
mmetsp:Transcript_37886/g.52878  ORF Transcript_37886/g.52878 Transcript_37886/m.52878 type:complete len:273 (-) Transcript_37886:203-1021(-)